MSIERKFSLRLVYFMVMIRAQKSVGSLVKRVHLLEGGKKEKGGTLERLDSLRLVDNH